VKNDLVGVIGVHLMIRTHSLSLADRMQNSNMLLRRCMTSWNGGKAVFCHMRVQISGHPHVSNGFGSCVLATHTYNKRANPVLTRELHLL